MRIYLKVVLSIGLLFFCETAELAAIPGNTAATPSGLMAGPKIPGMAMKGGVARSAADFLLVSSTFSVWIDQDWMGISRTSYIYNSRNQIFQEILESYDMLMGEWRDNYRVTFNYDLENRLSSEIAEQWNGVTWMVTNTTEISYDGEDRIVERYGYGDGFTLETFIYDNDGRLTESIFQITDDLVNPWENSNRYLYGYEGSGINYTEIIYQEWAGGEWVNRDRNRITYHNLELYQIVYQDTWTGQEWSDLAQTIYTYGENDWLDEKLYQQWDGNAWQENSRTVITHDAHGNALTEITVTKVPGDEDITTKVENIWEGVATDTPEADPAIPQISALGQNSPNPFNASTAISFTLPTRQDVSIRVYNILGQEVEELVRGNFSAGEHTVIWDGNDGAGRAVSSGIYFYTINTAEKALTRKMVLLK